MAESSKWWPYVSEVAKALTVPGTEIGPGILVGIKDRLDAEEHRQRVDAILIGLRDSTKAIQDLLERERPEEPDALQKVAQVFYLEDLALTYMYADFKGIQQYQHEVYLKLDDIFVDVKAAPERAITERREREQELVEQFDAAEETERYKIEARLAEMESARHRRALESGEGQPVAEYVKQAGGTVLLGGPGTGKTTLVKRLARSAGLGAAEFQKRFPQMEWRFPVVVPVAQFAADSGDLDLMAYVEQRMRERGGEPLLGAFQQHWAEGHCLLMLDGLDEVVQEADRVSCARAVEKVCEKAGGNTVLVTSRAIGYGICRLSCPAEHIVLQGFSRDDVETFVRRWEQACQRSAKPDAPDMKKAEDEAQDLIGQIESNPRVESLATNPLMLTIIAFIKRRKITLPDRRGELYEAALETLMESWHQARSLAASQGRQPMGEDLPTERAKELWAGVACWMHEHKAHGTCHRKEMYDQLCQALEEDGLTHHAAAVTAESYLAAAAERVGLLEERGHGIFAFMHLTFQEYLAAYDLCSDPFDAVERVMEKVHDPRWHEVVLLAAGICQKAVATRIVDALLADPSPLEPYTCQSLRLAAACLGDQVRVKAPTEQQVLLRLLERLPASPYRAARWALCECFAKLSTIPGAEAVAAAIAATEHGDCHVRMEAARCLERAAEGNPQACRYLAHLFEKDTDSDVKAHAAWGLWRAKANRSAGVVATIVRGFARGGSHIRISPDQELASALVSLLSAESDLVRVRAARVLGGWGHQEEAVPALVSLLSAESDEVRLSAARVLGGWGHQEEAVRALVSLLSAESDQVRWSAAHVLGGWGHQAEAVPVLVSLLSAESDEVRVSAAEVLGGWGHQADAVPALVSLLSAESDEVRWSAAYVLKGWGHQEEAVPALVSLLSAESDEVRLSAAHVLGGWGHQEEAVPALVSLLSAASDEVRVSLSAAEVLWGWGPGGGAAAALLTSLVADGSDIDPAVRFLESPQEAKGVVPDDAAAILVRCIEPQQEDTSATTTKRGLVFIWLWNAVEGKERV